MLMFVVASLLVGASLASFRVWTLLPASIVLATVSAHAGHTVWAAVAVVLCLQAAYLAGAACLWWRPWRQQALAPAE